jgi:hypothetical protein
VHQILRSRELLEKSGIAHARLEGGRSNRRSHDDGIRRAMEEPRKKKEEGRLTKHRVSKEECGRMEG